MKRFSWLLFGCGLLLSIITAVPSTTKAATNGIQISPLTFNLEIPKNGSSRGEITVTNTNDELLNYVIEVENFAGVTDDGSVSFAGTELAESVTTLSDWFVFDAPREGQLEARKNVTIGFTINLPADAEPGGHYAAVFAREVKKDPNGNASMGIASRVGVLVLVSVPGDTKKTAIAEDFTFPKFVWRGPNDFTMKVKNTGTVHYDSSAKVELKNIFGRTTTVDMGKHTLIPENSRKYTGTWKTKYPFGYYKVTAQSLDGNNNPVTSSGIIWAIPLIIVIPTVIGLILVILIIRYLRRHIQFRA